MRDDERLAHIHRVTTQRKTLGEVCAIAFDHRAQFEEIAERHGKAVAEISRFKQLIAAPRLESCYQRDPQRETHNHRQRRGERRHAHDYR